MRYEDVFGFIDADTPIPNGFCSIPLENRPQVLAEIASIVRDEKKVKNDDDDERTARISS